MFTITNVQYNEGFKDGALEVMKYLNSIDLFDNLSDADMEKVERKIIAMIKENERPTLSIR